MKFQAFVTKCTIYYDDVFIFSDLFKRLLSNFSVICIFLFNTTYFGSCPVHV